MKNILLPCIFIGAVFEAIFSQPLPELIPYRQGDKWGYVDSTGHFATQMIYDYAEPFRHGLAVVGIDTHYGVINRHLETIVPIDNEYIYGVDCANGPISIKFKEGPALELLNRRWQDSQCSIVGIWNDEDPASVTIYDTVGQLVSPLSFEYLERLRDPQNNPPNQYKVCISSKCGILDKYGQLIIPCIYDDIYYYGANTYHACLDTLCGLFDTLGNMLTSRVYTYIQYFKDTLTLAHARIGKKAGFLDHKGGIVLPFIYSSTYGFRDGFAAVKIDSFYHLIDAYGQIVPYSKSDLSPKMLINGMAVSRNWHYGVVDSTGNALIPFEYNYLWQPSIHHYIVKKNDRYGVVDNTNNIIIPLEYNYVSFDDRSGHFKVRQGKFEGYLDTKGNWIVEPVFNGVPFSNTLFAILQKTTETNYQTRRYALFHFKTGHLTDFEYTHFYRDDYSYGYVRIYKEDRCGLLDSTGALVIPIQFRYVDVLLQDRFIAEDARTAMKGMINLPGDTLIPFQYEYLRRIGSGLIKGEVSKKAGDYYDLNGLPVTLPFVSDMHFQGGLTPASVNRKWGLVDTKGTIVIPYKYDFISTFYSGLAQVSFNGKDGYIDRTGKEYFSEE